MALKSKQSFNVETFISKSNIVAAQLASNTDPKKRDKLIREYAKALAEDVREQTDYIIAKRIKGA